MNKQLKTGEQFPGVSVQKERICCTSIYFHQGETLPTSWCDVTWVLRGLGPGGRAAHLFWTMLMATQSAGYTFFPMRSLNMMNVSIRKSYNSKAKHLPSCFIGNDWKDLDLVSCSNFFFFLFWRCRKGRGIAFHYVNPMKPIEVDFQMKSYN